MQIPISSIAVLNRQRKSMDPQKVADLAADIEARGLLHPPVVRSPYPDEDIGDKTYVLMVGGRRTAAHILLGRTEIEVKLKDDLDPVNARIAELNENVNRENLTWNEELDARAEIAALTKQLNPNAVHSEVAAAVGVSEAQLTKDLQLHKMVKADPSLRSAASKGSALRTAVFKTEIDLRIANVQAVALNKLGEIRQKIVTADARDFVRKLPDNSVDLVFTDLPYGIDYFAVVEDAKKGVYDDTAETTKDFIADIVPEALRVVKPTGWIVFFMCYEWHGWLQELIRDTCKVHHQYREPSASVCAAPGASGCDFYRPELPPWIWTRRGSGNHGHWPELHASNRYEVLVVANGGFAKLTKKPVENVLDFPPFSGDRLHAMQKPHDLCVEIIERTTVRGELVLDLCYGSGAHLAAAAASGRDFLGCDSNPDNLGPAISLVAQHFVVKS